MSKEEKEKLLILNNIEFNRLNDEENEAIVIVNNLIQSQQTRIEKAIEYIEKLDVIYEYSNASGEESILDKHKQELLQILKGENENK